jgi:hypothetical protein
MPEFDPNWAPDGTRLVFAPFPGDVARERQQISILDVKTMKQSPLAGSQYLFSPRWSPQGNFIAALSIDGGHLMLLDVGTSKWVRVADGPAQFPMWSLDGKYIHFLGYLRKTTGAAYTLARVAVPHGEIEHITTLDMLQPTSSLGAPWAGLTPDGSPLILRDIGVQEIYALRFNAR